MEQAEHSEQAIYELQLLEGRELKTWTERIIELPKEIQGLHKIDFLDIKTTTTT